MKTCLIVPALALAMAISLTMTHDTSAGRPTQEPTGGLSDDERAALADLESSDRFRNIAQGTKQLSVERAREYVEYTERRARSFYGLTRLELSNVSEISDKTAKELAKHRGWLFLNGLTSISDAGAEALSQHHGRLYLNGLKTLSDEAAKSLAQHGLVPHRENDLTVKGAGLHLDGLTTLSDEAARALAQQKGELWLRGLTTLSDEAAAVLRQKRDIRLPVNFRGEKNEAANSRKPSHRTYVYAKIILPIKSPAKGEHPAVESWIAKKLRRRGETEFRAVTNWVRLAEGGEGDSDIWAATADGKNWGCPVSGRISERTADGKVKVELSGWSPVAVAKIKGGTLAAETGSRTIATVDTGIDQDGRAFVALVVGPGKATHDHAKKHSARFHKLYSIPTGDKDGFKYARVAVSINQKSVLSRNYLVTRGEDVRDRIGAYLWSLNPDGPKRTKLPDSTTFGFVPDSTLAYQVHWGDGVQFWDTRTHTRSGDYIPHELREDTTIGPALSPSGKVMVTRSQLNHLQFWNIETRKPITTEIKQAGTVYGMEFSSDGKWFFSKTNKKLAIWDPKTGTLVAGPLRHAARGFAYSPKNDQVVTVQNNAQEEEVWSSELVLRSGKAFEAITRVRLDGHAREAMWIGDTNLLVVGDKKALGQKGPFSYGRKIVYLISLASDKPESRTLMRHDWIPNVSVAPDQRHFTIETRDNTSCWKVGHWKPLWTKPGGHRVSFGDNGWVLLHNGPALAYSLADGKELWRKENVDMARAIGSHIWTCNENKMETWKVELEESR